MVIDGFSDHTAKLEAAATEIPEESLLVGHRAFQVGAFQAGAVQFGASAKDWNVRLNAMFVDWVPDAADGLEGHWQWGVKTNVEVLATSINAVGGRLTKASVEWT